MTTETQLIEALAATESIIRARFSRKIGMIGQRVAVEDLLQSVALKAFKSLSKCTATTEEELNHWVLTIAQNCYKSLLTTNYAVKRSAKMEGCAIGVATDESRDGFQPADMEGDASVKAEIAEEIQQVLSMLDQLTPDRARAIRMRYLDQMELNDIAEVMGISNEAVRCLVSKGLAKIRKQLVAC